MLLPTTQTTSIYTNGRSITGGHNSPVVHMNAGRKGIGTPEPLLFTTQCVSLGGRGWLPSQGARGSGHTYILLLLHSETPPSFRALCSQSSFPSIITVISTPLWNRLDETLFLEIYFLQELQALMATQETIWCRGHRRWSNPPKETEPLG